MVRRRHWVTSFALVLVALICAPLSVADGGVRGAVEQGGSIVRGIQKAELAKLAQMQPGSATAGEGPFYEFASRAVAFSLQQLVPILNIDLSRAAAVETVAHGIDLCHFLESPVDGESGGHLLEGSDVVGVESADG